LVKSTDAPSALQEHLKSGFVAWGESEDDSEELHELEGYVPGLWRSKEEWLWTVLCKFLAEQRKFPPCMNVWCREWYEESPKDPFPHQQGLPEEEVGLELETREMDDHQRGSNSDHLMAVPFECDLCHYRNLQKRDPVPTDPRDVYLLIAICRVNLDAFWDRAANTVKDIFSQHAQNYEDTVKACGLPGEDFLPQMGWPVFEDRVGMALRLSRLCMYPCAQANIPIRSSTAPLGRLILGTPMRTLLAKNTTPQPCSQRMSGRLI
jgi:hypothetical protein